MRGVPFFGLVVVASLALGIGANTAMFSIVDGVLLKPLPFLDPNRLIRIWGDVVRQQASLVALRDRSRTTDYAAYSDNTEFNFTGHGEPQRLVGSVVTANLFAVLGQKPLLGRLFHAGEEKPGSDQIAMLSYSLWQNQFHGDPTIIGRSITIDDIDREVVGVMPRGFHFPNWQTQIWLPTRIDPRNVGMYWWVYNLNIVGRLRPGFSRAQAEAELRSIIPRIRDSFPWKMWPDWGMRAHVISLHEALVGNLRTRLLILLAAVALVLLIACANVANLLLARGVSRHQEISVRAALGANRNRIVRQLLTESLFLAVIGGLAGLALAFLIGSVFRHVLPASETHMGGAQMDLRVLAFTALAELATGLGFGVLPAVRSSKADLQNGLKSDDRGSSGSRGRQQLAAALVSFEIAIAVVVVISAGLLARSFWALININPGFQSKNILTALVTPGPALCKIPARCVAFYQNVLDRTRSLPGVVSAAAANPLPLSGDMNGGAMEMEGHPVLPGHAAPTLWATTITPSYFSTMGIPLLSGRGFVDSDRERNELVAVVTASTASRWWRGENPIGKHLRYVAQKQWRRVVGVVGDTRDAGLAGDPDWLEGHVYFPFSQSELNVSPRMSVIVKAATNPLALIEPLRRTVAEIQQDVPVTETRTMEEVISQSIATPRSTMWVLFSFAVLAFLLSSVGTYSVIAYTVAQRTREFGIRMALGADARRILAQLIWRSLAWVSIGLATGTAGAYAATRTMRTLLFQVTPHDLVTFIGIPALLLLSALIATYIPARRATKVDPMVTLRYE